MKSILEIGSAVTQENVERIRQATKLSIYDQKCGY